jgi:hypothetical protein
MKNSGDRDGPSLRCASGAMSWINNAKDCLAYPRIVENVMQPGRNGLQQLERQNRSGGTNFVN